jgi:hypothetical protein
MGETEDEVGMRKRQEAAVKLGLDLEPYDTFLGPDYVPAYIDTLMAMQRQLTRKLNRIAKHVVQVQYLDFQTIEDSELSRIMEEDPDDDE